MPIYLWPSHSIEIKTTRPLEECVAQLNSETEPNRWFRWSGDHKTFQGVVSRAGFKISRVIHYRNSFLPIVHGSFKPSFPGTAVLIRMRLHPLVSAFLCVWFGGVGFALAAFVSARQWGMIWVPVGFFLFGLTLVNGSFWFEAQKTESALRKCL